MKLKQRSQVEVKDKWRTQDLFSTDEKWNEAYASLIKDLHEVPILKDSFQKSKEDFLNCLKKSDELSQRLETLYVYAHLKSHEDTADSFYQGFADKADSIAIKFSSAFSFLVPSILEIGEEVVLDYISDSPIYTHYLKNILRQKEHILSHELEKLLSEVQELGNAPSNIFSMINNADLKFPNVHDENGKEIELTKGNFVTLLHNAKREVRIEAFHALYTTYNSLKNTFAQSYSSSVKKDVFFSQTRKFNSSLACALSDDNIPTVVYDSLLTAVNQYLSSMHDYIALRKKLLNLSEIHMYDLYTPIISDVKFDISYEEAKEIICEALKPLGEEYIKALRLGFENGWIDVYENVGKRSGAYSWGASSSHPFVLMNYENSINSLFTLAHEMGHALHSYFTWKKQPYLYAGHKIFVAEVASTVNEALLIEYLLSTTTDKQKKAFFINHYLEQFRGTLFRQTMFAEFEKITHEFVESGESLTSAFLCQTYRDLNTKYYGKDIIIDELIDIEWARIPHFYNAFYVYQYATGFSAAVALSQKILKNEDGAIQNYLAFLESGCSDYSINLLKKAGVDMSSPQPIVNALAVFQNLIKMLY